MWCQSYLWGLSKQMEVEMNRAFAFKAGGALVGIVCRRGGVIGVLDSRRRSSAVASC